MKCNHCGCNIGEHDETYIDMNGKVGDHLCENCARQWRENIDEEPIQTMD